MQKVFLGVSGGIDSFASALILKNMGYDVIGVHLLVDGVCREDLCALSEKLGIEIISYDVSSIFKEKVIDNFINTYVDGGVPSPCVECNRHIKWNALKEVSDSLGGGFIATGHYCRVEKIGHLYFVNKGVDNLKDQSYYLWQLDQEILSRAIFPLGDMTKEEVKKFVSEKGYVEMSKRNESMGLCFMGGKRLKEYLLEQKPELKELDGGDIIANDGTVLGKHGGYPFYTLAQRRGLSLPVGMCVTGVDKDTNRLLIGYREDLFTSSLHIKNMLVTSKNMLLSCKQLSVKVRGVGVNPDGYATININNNEADICLSNDAWAVVSGQPVVLYDGDIVLGGGIVK